MNNPSPDFRGVTEQTCSRCGMPRQKWQGKGVTVREVVYCCQGCADGTGCTCDALRRLKVVADHE